MDVTIEKRKVNYRKNICNSILDLDDKIRFVGIVNKDGEVIDGGFKKGVEPLLDDKEEQEMYLQSLSNMTFFQSFSKKFGPVDYIITKQKRITMITFPMVKDILCVSIATETNIDRIRDNIVNFLYKQ